MKRKITELKLETKQENAKANVKRKDFCISIYGSVLEVKQLKSLLHNDLRHFIQGYLRKRPKLSLSKNRLEVLFNEIVIQGMQFDKIELNFTSIEYLSKFIVNLRTESRSNFNANDYYNQKKSIDYSKRNLVPQKHLSQRCLDLVSLEFKKSDSLALDICCGSGLSCFNEYFTIGVDASEEMLNLGRTQKNVDFVLWDLKQKLPFRNNSFDFTTSTSAIHFLCGPTNELQRCEQFFSSLKKICKNDFCFQFFPEKSTVPKLLLNSAIQYYNKKSTLVLDYTHKTKAFRWFLSSNSKSSTIKKCQLAMRAPKTTDFLGIDNNLSIGCCLSIVVDNNTQDLFKKHLEWMKKHHCKEARTLIRKYNFNKELLSSTEIALTEKLIINLGMNPSLDDVFANYDKVEKIVHTS